MPASGIVYGAYGYTGELVARRAVAAGLRPVLAGRRAEPLRALAAELGLEARAFGLDDPSALARELAGAGAVLHCAGPFAHTWRAMVEGCLAARCHYLDVTGEVDVFEGIAALSARAEAARVMLLPGVGFDVVPSDNLAAHVAGRLPGAARLRLAFTAVGGVSRGTALTMVERLGSKGLVRRGGALVAVRPFARAALDLGDGRRRAAVQIPWGDLATAWRSTRIPDIEVFMTVTRAAARSLQIAALAGPLLRLAPLRRALAARVRAGAPGPSAEARARGRSLLWAEAGDGAGRRAAARLEAPEGYTLKATTAVAALQRALRGDVKPGFQTPSTAYGKDFVLDMEGVRRVDL